MKYTVFYLLIICFLSCSNKPENELIDSDVQFIVTDDEDGSFIENANIKINGKNGETVLTTDVEGSASTILKSGKYSLSVEKEGFIPNSLDFSVNDTVEVISINLIEQIPEGFRQIPLQSSITEVQPMTGIVFWNSNAQRESDAISLEFSYMLYKDVVKEKDVYDWSVVDNLLTTVAARKHQAIFRFRYVYVGDRETAVPQYIRDLHDYHDTLGVSEGRDTRFPDWRHPELQRFHLDFHKKFAERYDNDPRLAFLQTGFGLWGEFHIYDGIFIEGRTFPSKEFQETIFTQMNQDFKKLPWSISKDAADGRYGPFRDKPELKNLKFGIFDDSFMHQTHGSYNTSCWNFFDRERSKTSPAGGEFGFYVLPHDQQNVLNPEGMYGRTFESEAAKFRISYMIGDWQPTYQTMERIKEASMACGYRFHILNLIEKDNVTRVKVANKGVAPIYYDAYISINGVKAKESLITLLPGTKQWYEIPTGGNNPVITIECERLVPGQKIEFEANLK